MLADGIDFARFRMSSKDDTVKKRGNESSNGSLPFRPVAFLCLKICKPLHSLHMHKETELLQLIQI